MGGWEWAIYLALMSMASERKKQSYEAGQRQQADILDLLYESQRDKSTQNEEQADELLGKLGKDSVVADQASKSRRVNALMKDMSKNAPTANSLVSDKSPTIVKEAMNQAITDMTENVRNQGKRRADLSPKTNSFGKYNKDFVDANTLAANLAGQLKGESAVADIGLKEAANTYDFTGDILKQLSDLYGTYMMFSSGGEDPTVVEDSPTMELTPTNRQGGNIYKYADYV